jgi:hypothetical protein
MFGTRQSLPRARGRSILALSTLALLAFCCLPVLAQASSAGYEYQDAVPTPTGKSPSESNLSGGSGSTSGIGSHAGSGSGDGGSKGGKSSDGAGGSSEKSGSGANGKNGVDQQSSQGKDGKNTLDVGSKPTNSTAPGSDGGSSPLIPILIAIVILAGGSVAYVMIKRRRSGGEPGSSEPGSPDSSVSPEAS